MNDAEKKVDTELDRLLGGGGLSALEEDNILHNVLVAVRQEKAEAEAIQGSTAGQAREAADAVVPMPDQDGAGGLLARLNLWFSLPVAAAAAAAVFFVVLPEEGLDAGGPGGQAGQVADDPQGSPEFSPRGGDDGQPGTKQPATTASADRWQLSAACGGPCRAGHQLTVTARPREDGFLTAAALGPDEVLVWLFVGEAAQAGVAFGYKASLPADLAPGAYKVVLLSSKERPADDKAQLISRLEKHVAAPAPAASDPLPEISITVEP